MNIEKVLREYKTKKSKVDTALARIEAWKNALKNPEDVLAIYKSSSREPGMPKGTSVSDTLDYVLFDVEEGIELIKEWVKEDESRIYPLRIEVEQIELALNSLTKSERYVVESKYFDSMFWNNIEINYNEKFREKNYVTVSRLRQINKEALDKLEEILIPFYNRYSIA